MLPFRNTHLYIEAQTAASDELETKAKLADQWLALCLYRTAVSLSEGGNQVHPMYWYEKPLIENLGSGTVDVVATLLGNSAALEMYGSVMNEDLSETLQVLMHRFICGDALQLYPNEIRGVDAIDWKAFPGALIVSDGKLPCDSIERRSTVYWTLRYHNGDRIKKRRSLRSPPMMYGMPQIASGTGKTRQSGTHPTEEGNSRPYS